MAAFLPIFAVLIIAVISLMVVRVGAMALRMTGMSWDSSVFQAYSAFFGVGFTTLEAESVVRHPARRRVIQYLMVAGNVGLTGAVGALVVAFVKADDVGQSLLDLGAILVGLGVLWAVSRLRSITRLLDPLIRATLSRSGVADTKDYGLLLRVEAGYCVSQLDIPPGHWLAERAVLDTKAGGSEILVLGILRRDGNYVGAPGGSHRIHAGDLLTVYGTEEHVRALAEAEAETRV